MRMPFGKHRGVDLSKIPESYLLWILDNADYASPTLKEAIREQLEIGRRPPPPPPPRARSERNLDHVLTRWQRAMAMRWHPDRPGGDVRVMKALNDAADQLREALQ